MSSLWASWMVLSSPSSGSFLTDMSQSACCWIHRVDLHRSPEFSLWVACFFCGTLPCECQKPGLLGFSIPQLRHLQSSAWDPSQSHPLDTLKAAYWGNHRVYLICLPSFSDHWTLLTDVECLENHCLNYLSFCMCVLGSVVSLGRRGSPRHVLKKQTGLT